MPMVYHAQNPRFFKEAPAFLRYDTTSVFDRPPCSFYFWEIPNLLANDAPENRPRTFWFLISVYRGSVLRRAHRGIKRPFTRASGGQFGVTRTGSLLGFSFFQQPQSGEREEKKKSCCPSNSHSAGRCPGIGSHSPAADRPQLLRIASTFPCASSLCTISVLSAYPLRLAGRLRMRRTASLDSISLPTSSSSLRGIYAPLKARLV